MTPASRIKEIAELEALGVPLAQGNGSGFQKIVVHGCQLFGLAVFGILVHTNPVVVLVLPVVCVGIDFLSGFVHWFFDTQVTPGETMLGRIATNFLDHHLRPARTCEVGFVVSAYLPALYVTFPVVALSLGLGDKFLLQAALYWVGMLAMYVPQTHKLAHQRPGAGWLKMLQSYGVILNPGSHARHHRDNAQAYCVFTGWLNPVLDQAKFWHGLEVVFQRYKAQPW